MVAAVVEPRVQALVALLLNPQRKLEYSVYRWCRRCKRWRSIGNFSVHKPGGKVATLGHRCHLCWTKGGLHPGRSNWTITDSGRAALREAGL